MVSDQAHYGDLAEESFPPFYLNSLAPVSESEPVAAMPSEYTVEGLVEALEEYFRAERTKDP